MEISTVLNGLQSSNPAPLEAGSSYQIDPLSFNRQKNPTEDLGFIAGIWFTIWGRNSANFLSEVISFTYTF